MPEESHPRPQDPAGRSGREVLQAIIDGRLPAPPIGALLGFRIVGVGDGSVAFEGEPGPQLCNPSGLVHGGWALTLLDSVTGCAAHSTLPAGTGYTTLETKGHFTRAITPTTGPVRAEGKVVAQGRKVITAEGWLRDAAGRLLAHGTSTLLVLPAQDQSART